jgi:carboxymethylenebutenolidase
VEVLQKWATFPRSMKTSHKILFGMSAACIALGSASAQDWAKARLDSSPRHMEWVTVKHDGREVKCFVAFPEVKNKATAVIVIHEIFGLTDWVRGVADQLAEAGYIAIAPDLLSGAAPGGGGTAELGGADAVRKAISSLPPAQITADLNAVKQYVSKLPAANGKVAVAGFCWGGGQSFRYATNAKDIKAACVFYGPPPTDPEDVARIQCSVYGFYGESDARITSTVDKTAEQMKKAGKTYKPVTYPGAGHGFMRAGEAPDASEANKKARNEAWKRLKEILEKL